MKDRKFQLNWYQASDTAAIERKLEKMAQKGWLLEKLTNWGFHYSRSESTHVRYSVTFFPEASIFDGRLTDGQLTYADYCAAAGWALVGSWGPLQVFRSTRPDPTPIETDEGEKLQAIHKSMLKTWVLSYGLLLAVWLLNLFTRLESIRHFPLSFFSSNQAICFLLFLLCFIAYMVYMLADHFVWYFRSKRAVERGEGCLPTNTGLRLWLSMVLLAVCAVMVLATAADVSDLRQAKLLAASFCGMALILAVSQLILHGMKKLGFSRGVTRGVFIASAVVLAVAYSVTLTTVIAGTDAPEPPAADTVEFVDETGRVRTLYRDELPVTLEDLGYTVTEEDHCSYEVHTERSVLMEYRTCTQTPYGSAELPALHYRVVSSGQKWVLRLSWKLLERSSSGSGRYREADGTLWGAEDAFFHRAPDGLCLLYGDRILVLDSWDSLDSQAQSRLVEALRSR